MPTPDDAPDGGQWDIFVSYARQDDEVTRKLIDALAADGRSCWVDWQDIRAAADWMEEIRAAIDGTQAFVFVISPDSARSAVCRRELEYAAEGNKRILPVVARDPGDIEIPEVVGQRNWIFLRPGDDFDEGVRQLEGALDTEPEWAATHTRLLVRAREWERSGRDSSFLLRGSDLRAAEDWLSRSEGSEDPRPTPLHTEHVIASRRAATRGQRIRTAALGAGLLITAVLAFIAIGQRNRAEDQARVARSGELAARALLTAKTRPFDALSIAVEAARTAPTDQAAQALRQTLQQTATTTAVISVGARVNGVALDPVGDLLAVAADRGAVTLWNRRGEPEGELETGAESAKSVSFSADGRRLSVALGTDGIQIWDLDSNRIERRIATTRAVGAVALSPDGRSVAAGGVGGATVTRVANPHPVHLDGAGGLVFSVAFSTDGKRIIAGGRSGVATVFRARDGQLLRTLDVSRRDGSIDVNGTSFSPGGAQAITADQSGRAMIWDLKKGTSASTIRASRDEVTAAVVNENGHRLLTAGFDNNARVWDLVHGKPRLLMNLKGHEGAITSGAISPNGRVAITGSADGTARVWDAAPDDAVSTLPAGSAMATSYDSTGDRLMTVERTVQVWGHGENRIAKLRMPPSVIGALDAEFSADGSMVVTSDYKGSRVRVWDLHSASQVVSFKGPAGTAPQGAEFTPDGTEVVAAYDDGTIKISDAGSGMTINQFQAPSTIRSIDLSPDGETLATGSDTGVVWIWHLATQELAATLRGHADYVGSVRFNADGSRLVSASDDRTAIVWGLPSGEMLTTLTGHTAPVSDADFSPDSTRVATSSEDGTVRVWDAATGAQLDTLNGFPSFVYGVDYSPDGVSIAAVGGLTDVARIFECDLCISPVELLGRAENRLDADLVPGTD